MESTRTVEAVSAKARSGPAAEADLFVNAFSGIQDATQRSFKALADNLSTGAAVAREFQAHNADFGRRAIELNVEAARALGSVRPLPDRLSAQLSLGASALELYFTYLDKSAELVRRSLAPRDSASN